MELSNQVVSLDLSQQLAELLRDKAPESLYRWVMSAPFFDGNHSERDLIMDGHEWQELMEGTGNEDFIFYPAYTVSELGELLPTFIEKAPEDYTQKERYFLTSEKSVNSCWSIVYAYYLHGEVMDSFSSTATTEANARAKCLIRLIEDNLWTSTA